MKITEEYYKKLYSFWNPSPIETTENLKRVIANVNIEIVPDITMDEIVRAIQEIKRNRAAEEDGVLMELLKEGRKSWGVSENHIV